MFDRTYTQWVRLRSEVSKLLALLSVLAWEPDDPYGWDDAVISPIRVKLSIKREMARKAVQNCE